jgi:drug/metabolite transporter (DMT)-like permease
MTIVYALLTALCNALNVTMQHRASVASPPKARGWRVALYLFRNPLWLFGWVALAGAFLFQALALSHGEMSVVQPILVTELVFVLVLRRVWIRQTIRSVAWWSAALTCVSLSVFLAMAEPQGGGSVASAHTWVSASAATVGAAAVLTLLGLRGSPSRRAALMASATAIMWALVATFIKTMMETLSRYGVTGMFLHWPVYALATAGLAAAILNQVTLHVGPLRVSQPFLVIVDPIMSIALSVWVFGEYFEPSVARLTIAVVSLAVMCVAVTALTRTAPETMEPTPVSDVPQHG